MGFGACLFLVKLGSEDLIDLRFGRLEENYSRALLVFLMNFRLKEKGNYFEIKPVGKANEQTKQNE